MLVSRWTLLRRPNATVLGMAAMITAMMLLPMGDTISKGLTAVLPPGQIAAFKAVVQAIALGAVFLAMRKTERGRVFTRWSCLSGLLAAIVSFALITAFASMPIATAIAIFFVEPLALTLLAGVFLGERPGPRRYAAVAVGLCGVLLILRPNFAAFGLVVLYPLLAAVTYALNMIVTRRATQDCTALTFQCGASAFGAVILCAAMAVQSVVAPAVGTGASGVLAMPGWVIGGLIGSGLLTAAAFLLISLAFSFVQASVLAPFQYLEILGATALGYLVFAEVPDLLTLLGTLIILGSGLYIFHREQRADVPSDPIRARADH
ncbi:hypothetical protein BFP70_17415 [Thioclava sp. SK-1]|uniref:DMT family transporter n=1 Tax=Thioclava sp. SK-1 TaxID=1889770 RepID=UPI0008263F91|nr:DMT family transporter [Thioclava sp. SK-1]OCX60548.1 hypothetical protein BFP70_17415 [Thioclava sp. SK-1]